MRKKLRNRSGKCDFFFEFFYGLPTENVLKSKQNFSNFLWEENAMSLISIPKALSKAFIEEDNGGSDIRSSEKKSAGQYQTLGRIIDISTAEIRPNPNQPRRHFDTYELTSLAKSISQDGIIQPLTVRKTEGGFELVSGERRLRAAKLAGLRSVPCILINADEERSQIIALIENIQRADLNFFEEAEAIQTLISKYNMTQESAAIRLGFAQSTIANKLRVLKLSAEERSVLMNAKLGERHARALLKLPEGEMRLEAAQKAAENLWTVDALEKYIAKLLQEEAKRSSYHKRAVMLKDVRLFFNTVNKAMDVMRMAGVKADAKRVDHEGYIEYIITIPSGDDGGAMDCEEINQKDKS